MSERFDGEFHYAEQRRPEFPYYWAIRRKSDDFVVIEENYGAGCDDSWEADVKDDLADRDDQAHHFIAEGRRLEREELLGIVEKWCVDRALGASEIAKEAFGLRGEFIAHGHSEGTAEAAAINEIVEGHRATSELVEFDIEQLDQPLDYEVEALLPDEEGQ